MRLARLLVCALLALNSPFSSPAAPSATSTSQASVLLHQSLAALTGGLTLNDVTLTGSAQAIAGSDNETGTVTLQAVSAGASSLNLSLSLGQQTEILNASATPPTGSWSGPDGTVHQVSFHNLLTGPFWFVPAMALASSSSARGATVTYVGPEIHNGQAVQHLTITKSAPASLPPSTNLTQLEFYLDATTFLPAALDFNIHPDSNMLVDIPVEIRFSNYTAAQTAQVPFHIQKFINNTLALDLQLQNATLNAGLTVAQITAN